MHDLGWMTPAWGRVLARIFPGPHREKEIKAVSRILRDLHYNKAFVSKFNILFYKAPEHYDWTIRLAIHPG